MHPSRQAYVEDAEPEDSKMSGLLDLADVPVDHDHFMPNLSGANPEKASAILAQFNRKRLAATIAVPTDDKRVRARLREVGEPITLFGENAQDRRDRLRELLTQQAEAGDDDDVDMEDGMGNGDEPNEEYYTEGTNELLEARKEMARFSLPRSKKRLGYQKVESTITLRSHVKHRKAVREWLSTIDLFGSQIAAERPLAALEFSPNGETIAVGSWGGDVQLLDLPNLNKKQVFKGHHDIVSGLAWAPGATIAASNVRAEDVNLATGGGDGTINLWSLVQSTPLATLSGHESRVSAVQFHPSSKYLASASYDGTWRLWDVKTTTELLLQEGHSREVHSLSMNEDGSLIATGGLDSIGRVWDLRSGRIVMYLDSHMGPIYALDWSTDGYRVLSGSGDGFVKCWDVRAVKEQANIGAHTGGVTSIRWFQGRDGPHSLFTKDDGSPGLGRDAPDVDKSGDPLPKVSGTFVVTAGLDHTVKIFSADDWSLCKTLKAHVGNVTGADVTNDGRWIASSGRDRTVKLWGRPDMDSIYDNPME
ncbi:WD40 repeat-like protein [Microthyrium microscopicum]|uniref:WD40 repeat-like protein n=1 Tax=Microthyrium microscopicum TaxID=703497 RepID=A0A6A6URW3_9PEZI|nr:WD40 repeat-like protein [Microthyrium microscopicum]